MVARSLTDQGQPKERDLQAMPSPVFQSMGNEEQKYVKLTDTKGQQVVLDGPSKVEMPLQKLISAKVIQAGSQDEEAKNGASMSLKLLPQDVL